MALGKLICLALITTLIIFVSFSYAEAIPTIKAPRLYTDKPVTGNYGNFVTVELTQSCLALAKINATSLCPTYKTLAPFDSTNPKNAGKFLWDGVFYHRGKPFYKNYQLSYTKTKYPLVVCVDCSKQIIDYSKNIYVKSSGDFRYITKGVKMENFTRFENKLRYVDDSCTNATIAWNEALLADTITYLSSNCTSTKFNSTEAIFHKPSKLSYDGLHYQYLKMIEEAKKLKGINCLKSDIC